MNASLDRRCGGSEAGIALPMTLILMALITSLTVAFLAFTSAEPVIAANQMANTQARAIAESGVERALWALSKGTTNPGFGGSLVDPLPNPVPAPYNGTYVANGVGGFKVTVVTGPGANERTITSVGYVPNDTNPVAIKKIQTVVTHIPIINPPCAVCAGGEAPPGASTNIQVGGSASISAAAGANNANYCAGMATPTAAAYSQGTVSTNGTPNLTAPSGGSPTATNQAPENFTPFILTNDDMAMLKSLAKANGTYYKGNQTWTEPPPGGIIFVDTPSENVLTANSPSSDLITVDIHGNWSAGWNGWLVVAGSIQISGNTTLNGLIYAQNDVTLHGSGGGAITGAVISTNRVDTQSTNIDTDDIGNAPISYNCPAIQDGGGTIPRNWFVKPGTYKEVSGT
jgi:hypothetical protein